MNRIEAHPRSVTEILHIMVADASSRWDPDQRERVQRQIANFTLVARGVQAMRPSGNPFAVEEINKLREYVERAETGETFTPEEAREFRDISEKTVDEYPKQEWVADLLKIATFAFAVYALAAHFPRK